MSVFQKCPVCNGSGISPVPGTYSGIPICPTCNGVRIISQITGMAPTIEVPGKGTFQITRHDDLAETEKVFKDQIRFVLKERIKDPECTLDDLWNKWINENNL